MPESASRKTFIDALVDLFSALAASWNTPLYKALPRRQRFLYALFGTAPWVFVNFDPDWLSVLAALGPGWAVGAPVAQLAVAGMLAWLICFQDRPVSPTRLFLEGLVLPGVAAVLLSGPLLERLTGE